MSGKQSPVINIAHRGARSLAPENTLAAARKALSIGADWWELDAAQTADGVLVVLHDDSLERTSNAAVVFPDRAPWDVHTFTLAELRLLDFGAWFNVRDPFGQIAAGAVSKIEQQSYIGETIPTLEEALKFTRDNDWFVNIEIKDHSGYAGDAVVPENVAKLVQDLGMVDRVLISSFNHSYLRRVKTANARLATAALKGEQAHPDPAALVKALHAQGYNPGADIITPDEVRKYRAEGVPVYIWTVNAEADLRKWIDAGVSGLFTDFPQRLKSILNE